MRKQLAKDRETKAWNIRGVDQNSVTPAQETDHLLSQGQGTLYSRTSSSTSSHPPSNFRSRHTSRSPTVSVNQRYGRSSENDMDKSYATDSHDKDLQPAYNILQDDTSRSGNLSLGDRSRESASTQSGASRSVHQLRRSYIAQKDGGDNPPLLEIPEDIYEVRKSALQVLKPLTRTWLVVSVGFALSVLFGMARWTGLLMSLPFWFILLPSWLSHVGLFWCHVQSAKALSAFIASANDSRQRPDSRDHLDRTEYLPLLQRSLKFGLKTGLISFGFFIFEILVYFRLARGKLSLAAMFSPIWIMVSGGILDGIICKTQHLLRVICWLLCLLAMILTVLKVDYGVDSIRWRVVVSPIIAVLSIASASLLYIVYGHQIGYYRLSEAQLTAGNLYSLAALISIVLVVMVGEVMPLSRPVEIETRVFVVLMTPLVVALLGMGAWVVSRDEFGRLLLYGGQAAVHPKQLRWEKEGWSSIQGKGVTIIPMFGEVNFCPLEKKEDSTIEMCMCCTCYPSEEDEVEAVQYVDELHGHPYLITASQQNTSGKMSWQKATTPVQEV